MFHANMFKHTSHKCHNPEHLWAKAFLTDWGGVEPPKRRQSRLEPPPPTSVQATAVMIPTVIVRVEMQVDT